MTGLVLGVLGFNALLLAVGYCALSASLAGRTTATWASYAGVALLVGAGLVGTALFLVAIAGFSTGSTSLAVVAALLAGAGLGAARFPAVRERVAEPETPARRPATPLERELTLVAGFVVAVVALLALVGGFRSSPWLDDVWGIWLPKGIALGALGLDPRLFTAGGPYVGFEVLDYPLWWSILLDLDLRFVGEIDLRAANAQLALLTVAFLGAAARLLAGWIRPWLLAVALLLVATAPELLRHTQGGVADLPLAIYLALTALALAGWLARRAGFYLLLAAVFGATAVQVKSEGLPQLLLLLLVATVVAVPRARDALPGIWLAGGFALLSALPWLGWRAANDVASSVPLSDALSPAYLVERSERVGPAASALAGHLLDPREWTVLVPVVLALAAVAATRARRALPLAPAILLAAGFLFWVWAYWAESEDLDYLLNTSSYRVTDSLVLAGWVFVAPLAELVLRMNEKERSSPQELRSTR